MQVNSPNQNSHSRKSLNQNFTPEKLSVERLKSLETAMDDAFENPSAIEDPHVQASVIGILRHLESGQLRVCSPQNTGPACGSVSMQDDLREWEVHGWVKRAVLLAMRFRVAIKMEQSGSLPPAANQETTSPFLTENFQGRVHGSQLSFFDKFDTRSDHAQQGVRVVPPGVIREGAYVARGAIIMPGFVNIGAYVESGSMVDTWATVGSCAQVGKNVHLAGGVGIGGVLEPANARPVLIGDDVFVGSRAIVVEGTVVSNHAVLGANVCLTQSTPIYDVTTSERKEHRGYVPPYAVVAPGTRPKIFPGGEVQLQCAYIIAYRSEKTDAKVSLNDILRESGIAV